MQITGLSPGTTYYYNIPGGNGTTPSSTLSFTTAKSAGDASPFSVAIINDMGYTDAKGTHAQLIEAVDSGIAFAWHGGDISYADDWFEGILPCVLTGANAENCYNGQVSCRPPRRPNADVYAGSASTLPPGDDEDFTGYPLPPNEIPDRGTPNGGDFSTMYETNWDLWQNWMNPISSE